MHIIYIYIYGPATPLLLAREQSLIPQPPLDHPWVREYDLTAKQYTWS